VLFFGQNILKTINTFSSLAREFMRYPPRRPRTPFNKEIKQMGRPLSKRFFGLAEAPVGESVSALRVNGANSYSSGTTITFSASPIGGTTAEASVTFVAPADNAPGNGNVASTTITTSGTGYTSAPTVTFNKPANVTVDGFTQIAGKVFKFASGVTDGIYPGMVANAFFTTASFGSPTRVVSVNTATGNITMSTANTAAISSPVQFGDVGRLGDILPILVTPNVTANTIQANAWVNGGGIGRIGDIVSQKGSTRYKIANDEGTSVTLLEGGAPALAAGGPSAEGNCTITVSESTGATYYVEKITSRNVTLGVRISGTQFANGTVVPWSISSATANVSVKLATND
jgi:hypothetical protein